MRLHRHFPDEVEYENIAWISEEQVHAIHLRCIDQHGGKHGVLNPDMVSSALGACGNIYGSDLLDHAASLWVSLSLNHVFADGNKRTAFSAMIIFLRMNGVQYGHPDGDDGTFAFIQAHFPLNQKSTFTTSVAVEHLLRHCRILR